MELKQRYINAPICPECQRVMVYLYTDKEMEVIFEEDDEGDP